MCVFFFKYSLWQFTLNEIFKQLLMISAMP